MKLNNILANDCGRYFKKDALAAYKRMSDEMSKNMYEDLVVNQKLVSLNDLEAEMLLFVQDKTVASCPQFVLNTVTHRAVSALKSRVRSKINRDIKKRVISVDNMIRSITSEVDGGKYFTTPRMMTKESVEKVSRAEYRKIQDTLILQINKWNAIIDSVFKGGEGLLPEPGEGYNMEDSQPKILAVSSVPVDQQPMNRAARRRAKAKKR